MADRETIERSFVEHYRKYLKAIKQKDGFSVHYNYGGMNSMRRVLEAEHGCTEEEIQALIERENKKRLT